MQQCFYNGNVRRIHFICTPTIHTHVLEAMYDGAQNTDLQKITTVTTDGEIFRVCDFLNEVCKRCLAFSGDGLFLVFATGPNTFFSACDPSTMPNTFAVLITTPVLQNTVASACIAIALFGSFFYISSTVTAFTFSS